jgi:hypothetical protein
MAGTNQVTWTDKVKTRTLPIPIINKIDDATVNELKNKHNALDTEMTDPTTGLKKVVEDIAQNHPTQLGLISVSGENVATVVEPNIPTSGTSITFDAPRSYGSWKAPLSSLTIGAIADANDVTQIFFYKNTTIPARLNPLTNTDILEWGGDAFDPEKVNKLQISFKSEPDGDHIIEVYNEVKFVELDLIGYYQFGEAADNYQTAIDSSPFGNNGLNADASNTTRVAGKVGNAVQMVASGSSSHVFNVDDDPSMDFSNGITAGGWVRVTSANLGQNIGIMSKDYESSLGFRLYINSSDSRFRFELGVNNSASRVASTFVYNVADVWVHVMATHNGTIGRIYINGVEDGSTSFTGTIGGSTNPLKLCGTNSIGIRNLSEADQLRVYKRVLSASEILAIYNAEN